MTGIDAIATGKNIKRLRQEEGLTINDLQEALGFETPYSIYRWQKGDTLPSVDNLVILSDIFDVAMDEIVVRRKI